jgi:2-polyprenyl-6-methoxyphenol hydroxylase-like FAD-dependent oxidoreductase
MALEDALVLSSVLADAPAPAATVGDWDGLLDAFVARRRPRVEWVRQQTHRRLRQGVAAQVARPLGGLDAATRARIALDREVYGPLTAAP